MMFTKKPLAAAVLVVLALGTTACGGNNDDATAAKSISDTIMKQQKAQAGSAMAMTRSQADCFGNKLVDRLGTDKLEKYGLLTKNLKMNDKLTALHMSAKDADVAADTFVGCSDAVASMRHAMAQGGKVDPKVKSCIDKAVNQDSVHAMFVSVFSGKQGEATKNLSKSLMQCATAGTPPS